MNKDNTLSDKKVPPSVHQWALFSLLNFAELKTAETSKSVSLPTVVLVIVLVMQYQLQILLE